MGLTVKCGLPAVTAAFLSLLLAVAPPPASAEDMCSLLDRIVEAGEKDNPPFSSLVHFALPQAECVSNSGFYSGYHFECSWAHRYIDGSTAQKLEKAARKCARRTYKKNEKFAEWADTDDSHPSHDRRVRSYDRAKARKIEACGSYEQLRDRIYAPALSDAETLAASIKQCLHAGKIRRSWEPLEGNDGKDYKYWTSSSIDGPVKFRLEVDAAVDNHPSYYDDDDEDLTPDRDSTSTIVDWDFEFYIRFVRK